MKGRGVSVHESVSIEFRLRILSVIDGLKDLDQLSVFLTELGLETVSRGSSGLLHY